MADKFCLKMPDFHVTFRNLLHAVNLRHGTHGFTSPPKEGVLRSFLPRKIRRLRSGLNPRTWVPKASTLPLDNRSRLRHIILIIIFKSYMFRSKTIIGHSCTECSTSRQNLLSISQSHTANKYINLKREVSKCDLNIVNFRHFILMFKIWGRTPDDDLFRMKHVVFENKNNNFELDRIIRIYVTDD